MSGGSTLLYLDLESGFVGDADAAGFERFSERHYVELTPRGADPAQTPYTAYPHQIRPVVLALHNGLPTHEELAFSATVLSDGRSLYYHWPAENVVEVVTPERLKSFRMHRRVVNAYWGWRKFRRGFAVNRADLALRVRSNAARVKRRLRAAFGAFSAPPAFRATTLSRSRPSAPDPDRFSFLKEADGRLIAEGRGLYVRLDYWAKLKGGGKPPVFAGEVALVTGAASGIGQACVDALLARGAAVVGLDIKPAITGIYNRADYLGLVCDVTDEQQIAEALEGRTPYPVEDLVFDWSGKGATVKVAVVARETLNEAEATRKALLAQFPGQGIQRPARFFQPQHAPRRLRTGGHTELAFVVIQQQTPGLGIAQNQADHFPTDVGHQRLPGQGLAQQVYGLLQFRQPLLGQAVLVEAVAQSQVITQHAGGPLAETHADRTAHAETQGQHHARL